MISCLVQIFGPRSSHKKEKSGHVVSHKVPNFAWCGQGRSKSCKEERKTLELGEL